MTQLLTLAQLQAQRAAQPSTILIDALGERCFAAEHIPGAINVPHTVSDEVLLAAVPDRHATIVTYCANPACQNSHILAHRLRVLGYTNVAVFAGGKKEWTEAGLELTVAAVPA